MKYYSRIEIKDDEDVVCESLNDSADEDGVPCEQQAFCYLLIFNDGRRSARSPVSRPFFNMFAVCEDHDYFDTEEIQLRFFIKLFKKYSKDKYCLIKNKKITLDYLESLLVKNEKEEKAR